MKKSLLCLCLVLVVAMFNVLPAAACWMAPEPFEIFSGDGSKVFVFTPSEDGMANADAAVYEIVDDQRRLVYTVEDLSSFAYESNFHFSADMMHFARIFPPFGMDAFEVFSYGVRTRVVIRSDFIEDYDSVESWTSVGPFYTVTWNIEGHLTGGNTITISTGEDDAVLFDLTEARFYFEEVLPTDDEAPPEAYPDPAPPEPDPPAETYEAPPENSPGPAPQTQNSTTVIFVVVGSAVVAIAAGAFLLRKKNKTE